MKTPTLDGPRSKGGAAVAVPDVVTDGVVAVLVDKSPPGSVEPMALVVEAPVLSVEVDELVVETSSCA